MGIDETYFILQSVLNCVEGPFNKREAENWIVEYIESGEDKDNIILFKAEEVEFKVDISILIE